MQKYGRTALGYAVHNGHKQVVDVLLKAGANPDIRSPVTASSFLSLNLIIVYSMDVK